jgi:hypothetical protein
MDTSSLKLQTTKKGKDFWGPPQWGTIHIIAYNFKKGTEKELIEYLWLLTYLLPCDYCRKNLAFKLKNYPPTEYIKQGAKGVFLYSYMVHDLANQHITKHNPKTPKSSPMYEEVVENYAHIMKSGLWFSYIWASIHILAATVRQEYSIHYKRMLELLYILLPNPVSTTLKELLEKYPIDPYLRNNNDAFFYSYMLHDIVNKKLGKISPPYKNVKNYYFSSLGEECNDCKV